MIRELLIDRLWKGAGYPPDLQRENARLRDDLEIAYFVIATLEDNPLSDHPKVHPCGSGAILGAI